MEQNDTKSDPLGIRPGVWLFVVGMLLLCILVSLFHPKTTAPSGEIAINAGDASGLKPSTRPTGNSARSSRKTSDKQSTALTIEQAKRLACLIANQRARELYDCAPFSDGPAPSFVDGRWVWFDCRGQGHFDVEATVQFAEDGSAPNVDLQVLVPGLDFR